MRCFLAAFDQAHRAADGSYWTFRHRNVPEPVLDALYYDFAAKRWPEVGTPITCDDLRGGCARVHEDWVCWYRFIDGGRDTVGRQGRYVLLTAFIEQIHHQGRDWSGVLQSQKFQELARQAQLAGPLPTPSSLELEWNPLLATKASAIAEELVRKGSRTVDAAGALRIVAEVGWAVPNDCQFDCFVVTEQCRGRIDCKVLVTRTPQLIHPISLSAAVPPDRLSSQRIDPIPWHHMLPLGLRGSHFRPSRRMIRLWSGLAVAFCLGIGTGFVVGWKLGRSRAERPQLPQTNKSEARTQVLPLLPPVSDLHQLDGRFEEVSSEPLTVREIRAARGSKH